MDVCFEEKEVLQQSRTRVIVRLGGRAAAGRWRQERGGGNQGHLDFYIHIRLQLVYVYLMFF